MPEPEPDLPARLTAVFDLVGPLYRKSYRKVEQDAAGHGLSVGVRAVMAMLHARGPMTVPQLGRAQALSRQFVQRMVNEAADSGLVASRPNPAHKRSSLIALTAQGERAIAALLEQERAALRALGAGLSEADVEACVRVLGRLAGGLDAVDVARRPPSAAAAQGRSSTLTARRSSMAR
jgi:DNA-binding MarR family transcriptional regulator